MTTRNPKQEGSNLFDCKPQVGLCPNNCNQCFYNRPGAFYIDPNETIFPTPEEVGNGIVRVNCGHDSNIEREKVIRETECYPRRFFNTSTPKFDFPAPVVFTANRNEEKPALLLFNPPVNLMYVRLRVSATNLPLIQTANHWYANNKKIPVVLTFMAYYEEDAIPGEGERIRWYEWKKRHINSYYCPTREFKENVMQTFSNNKLVTMCGTLDSNWCRDCHNCETYYYQTIKNMQEA